MIVVLWTKNLSRRKAGLTVALSGAVGGAINNAVTIAQETKESSDSRLKALQATKTALSGVRGRTRLRQWPPQPGD